MKMKLDKLLFFFVAVIIAVMLMGCGSEDAVLAVLETPQTFCVNKEQEELSGETEEAPLDYASFPAANADAGTVPVVEVAEEIEAEVVKLTESAPIDNTTETVYATTGVYVRNGPGKEFDVIGGLKYRNSITRTGFADNGWSRVDYNGQTGYVCSDYLITTELTDNTDATQVDSVKSINETVYATTGVYVRNGPGKEFDPIGGLNIHSSITRTGISGNGWSRVDYNGQEGYVSSKYLSTTEPVVEVQVDIAKNVNEIVYATAGIYVRSGPGKEFDVIGGLKYRNSITRTGFADNGWSRVDYNGQTGYVCSDYLSVTKPAAKLGTTGRLTIPSVGVDVALYYCSGNAEYVSEQQRIVDAVDSAAYLEQANVGGYLIADHKHQGFNAMKASVPYETVAYIDFGDYTQSYMCIGIGVGKNLGNDLVDWNGVSLNYGHIEGGLAMYTCNENSTNITISYWQEM